MSCVEMIQLRLSWMGLNLSKDLDSGGRWRAHEYRRGWCLYHPQEEEALIAEAVLDAEDLMSDTGWERKGMYDAE